ncbi:MAG: major intrinsic protein [Gemmatimonadetes bacterium]|nr:major intrinsic protein [Gemmatimonadota bacterium]
MRDSWRHFAAEFIGTFALVFIGGGAIITSPMLAVQAAVVNIAFAHGLILALMVTATMRVSGHLNPAVTMGFLVTRRIEPMMAVVYWIAQFTGAIVAAYALKGLFPPNIVAMTRLGGQSLSADVTLIQAISLEAIATFFLVFVVFGTAVDPRAPKVGGFAIGLTVTAGILGIGPLTGGSMNPARSFGPAVVTHIFEGQAAYWLGPMIGAIAAALLYEKLFMPRATEPADHGAVRPVA